jgi:putative transposase
MFRIGSDRIRLATEFLYQQLIGADPTAFSGAVPFECSEGHTTQHNGSPGQILSTTVGDLKLKIPKLRTGTFFPALLERRRRVD